MIQRRVDNTVDFYKNWADYKSGFGDPTASFWIGLDEIHRITSSCTATMDIEMTQDGVTKHAIYHGVRVADESDSYRLSYDIYDSSSTVRDSVDSGWKFSTYDRDNDRHDGLDCAETRHAGWWFKQCSYSNLNGVMGPVPDDIDHTAYYFGMLGHSDQTKIPVDSCIIRFIF